MLEVDLERKRIALTAKKGAAAGGGGSPRPPGGARAAAAGRRGGRRRQGQGQQGKPQGQQGKPQGEGFRRHTRSRTCPQGVVNDRLGASSVPRWKASRRDDRRSTADARPGTMAETCREECLPDARVSLPGASTHLRDIHRRGGPDGHHAQLDSLTSGMNRHFVAGLDADGSAKSARLLTTLHA